MGIQVPPTPDSCCLSPRFAAGPRGRGSSPPETLPESRGESATPRRSCSPWCMSKRTRHEQLRLDRRLWGGFRPGAGRPANGRSRVPHRPRAEFRQRFPLHVTLRVRGGLPNLRRPAPYRVLFGALASGCEKPGFRVVEYSVQSNHVHLIVEGSDRVRIARGMQGLCVRMARRLNRLWRRRGSVFADRYHDVVLRTPRHVRHALVYVLQNARKHGIRYAGADSRSSAPWFDGWARRLSRRAGLPARPPTASARTWLLTRGWLRHGRLAWNERPALAESRRGE